MSDRDLCTNPECLLRANEAGSEFLTRLLVRVMAADDVSDALGGRPPIVAEERCVRCVQRVMRDQEPFPTVEQWQEDNRQGRRFHRRLRRRIEPGPSKGSFEPPFR